MSKKTITFRSQTVSGLGDLINDEGLTCQASLNLLTFLAGELLGYKDEGVEMVPTILFCTDSSAVFEGFPGSVRHVVGVAPLDASSVKRFLKDCAPLATRSWNIFVERISATEIKYGVFNYIALPTTLSLYDAVGMVSGSTALLLRKIAANTIQVRGSLGNELSLAFSTTREDDPQAGHPLTGFVEDCCSDMPAGPLTDEFRLYLERFLENALSNCHGTMLVCAQNPRFETLGDLKDGIEILPKLDFYQTFSTFRSDNSAESILRLQSAEDLFSGILQCDGIVVFDTLGSLFAYRVFYRPTTPEARDAVVPTGGARRRAFEGVKTMVGSTLKSAIFRSQDGLTLWEGGAR